MSKKSKKVKQESKATDQFDGLKKTPVGMPDAKTKKPKPATKTALERVSQSEQTLTHERLIAAASLSVVKS